MMESPVSSEETKNERPVPNMMLHNANHQAILASMSGAERSAVLLVTLGLEVSANIFKFLRQEEVEKIVVEIARISTVSIDKRDAVIAEAYQRAVALKYVREGGIEYAKEILERSLGAGEAETMTAKLFTSLGTGAPLDVVKRIDPSQIITLVQNENPQTVALILVYMEPESAGQVLSSFSPEVQADIAMRIALLQKTAPDVLEQLDELLGRSLLVAHSDHAKEGGVQTLATLMGYVDRETEKNILEGLAERDPDLAQEVKNLLFVFEDIAGLEDRSIQRILKEVNTKDLALALKTANQDLLDKIYKNMSQRAAESLKDDIEVLGKVRMRDVGKAQSAIVDVVRALEDSNEIIITRGNAEDQLV
jgi:flagellar motor switch protein FliG